MARKQFVYKLQRIRDSRDWPKGTIIWADAPCVGWRVIEKMEVRK